MAATGMKGLTYLQNPAAVHGYLPPAAQQTVANVQQAPVHVRINEAEMIVGEESSFILACSACMRDW